MAKIFESIEGYSEMSAEDKLKALESIESVSDNENELKTKLQEALKSRDMVSTEAKKWKQRFRETQTEAERIAAEREEENRKRDDELKGYKDRERISRYSQRLMASGYDAETASSMAQDLPEGMPDSFFESQRQFIENKRKAFESDVLNNQPGLSKGMPPKKMDTDSMSDSEYYESLKHSRR